MRRSKHSLLTQLARRRDERGATFVFTAICMVLLFMAGAMGVNIGFNVLGSRDAQGAADTGALDLTRYINLADGSYSTLTAANTYLTTNLSDLESDNGWGNNVTLTYTGGYWNATGAPGWSVPTAGPAPGCYDQFPAYNPPCTAVMVTATQKVPQIFFGGSASLSRTAIAALTPEDGFSIGSYLASASLNQQPSLQQTGVLNDILSVLSPNASVTAVGYQGLANTYVSIKQLIAASSGVLTTSNVLTTSEQPGTWYNIFKAAVFSQEGALNCSATPTPSACSAYTALTTLGSFTGSTGTRLCDLVSINGSVCSGNLSDPGLSANLDVLQTLTTEAELANGSSAINVNSTLGITGVTSATLSLDVIQPPQIAYGPVGVTATTAQVSSDLKLDYLGNNIDIPLSAAEGTASLKTVNCSGLNNTFKSAVVNASTQTATGSVTVNNTLPALGTLSVAGVSTTALQFNASSVPPTAATAFPSSGNPTNPVQLGSTISWNGIAGSGIVPTFLNGTLFLVLGPVLQAAGVSVGGASVADLDYNCGAVSIVK